MKPDKDSSVPAPRPRRRRRLFVAVVALLLVGGGCVLWLLGSASGRARVSGWLLPNLEERLGLDVSWSDWNLRPLRGWLVLHDLALAEGADPFLRIERIEMSFEPLSMLRRSPVVENLRVERPWLHLERLPAPGQPPSETPAPFPFRIDRLRVEDGQIIGGVVKARNGEELVSTWHATAAAMTGSLRGGQDARFDLDLEATLEASGPRLRDPTFEVTAHLGGPMRGPWSVESLRAAGPGLELRATGDVAPGTTGAKTVEFRLDAEPSRFLVLESGAATLAARGEIDLVTKSGRATVRAERAPVALVLDGAPDLLLDASGELRIDPSGSDRFTVDGEARAELRQGGASKVVLVGSLEGERQGTAEWLTPRDVSFQLGASARELSVESLAQWLPPDVVELLERGLATPLASGELEVHSARGDPRFASTGALELRGGDAQAHLGLRRGSFEVGDGQVDLATVEGDAELRLAGLDPAPIFELLARRIDAGEPGWVGVARAGDELRGAFSVSARRGRVELLGTQNLTWVDAGAAPIFEASAALQQRASEAAGVQEVDASVTLFPRSDEEIGLRARITPDGPVPLADLHEAVRAVRDGAVVGTLDTGRLELESLLARVEERVQPSDERWAALRQMLSGPLQVGARLEGSLGDLLVRGEMSWDMSPRVFRDTGPGVELRPARLLIRGEGRPQAAEWTAEAQLGVPDLSSLIELPWADLLASRSEGPLESPEEDHAPPSMLAGVSGSLSAVARASSSGGALDLDVRSDLWPLHVESVPELRRVRLDIGSAHRAPVQVRELQLDLGDASLRLAGDVDLSAAGPPRARLRLASQGTAFGITALAGTFVTDAEGLRLELDQLQTSNGEGRVQLEAPWGALRGMPRLEGLGAQLEAWGVAPSDARPRLVAQLAGLRIELPGEQIEGPTARTASGEAAVGATLEATAVDLDLQLDPQSWSASSGLAEIGSVSFARGDVEAAAENLRLELGGRSLRAAPFWLRTQEQQLEVRAAIELSEWGVGAPAAGIVEQIDVHAEGSVDASLLTPYLGGGVADGPAHLVLTAAGTPDSLSGGVRVEAPDAVVRFLEPYATEISGPALEASLRGGRLVIESATAELNRGTLQVTGTASPRAVDVDIGLRDVRYRVDYGLSTQLSGDLRLEVDLDAAEGRLSGDVDLDRGLLRRSFDLEREILSILRPEPTVHAAPDALSTSLALDLRVRTRSGVRVRNNVADLNVGWSPLRVRGSLAEPRIDGVLDVEPGGLVSIYGQTVRLDQATVTLSSQPGAQPKLDLVTTTSLEDPSITRLAGNDLDPFSRPAEGNEERGSGAEQVAGGLAQYVGDRLLGAAGTEGISVGSAFSVRPVLVLTESEPSARLVVTRAITEQIDLGASFDMRNAEERTYLMDVHDLRGLPSLSAQLFTNDERNEGVTLQQVVQLGELGRETQRVGRVRVSVSGATGSNAPKAKRLARATGVRRGDAWDEALLFDAEIDIEEAVRRRGFPSPRVEVTATERGRLVDLDVQVELGRRARVEFIGLQPPSRLRSSIRLLYRSDFYEQASLRELERQTRQALLEEGWLEPQIEARVEPPDEIAGVRVVTISSESSRRLRSPELVLEGLPAETRDVVAARLESRGARLALASAEEQPLEALAAQLNSLGWRDVRAPDVEVDPVEERVTVTFSLRERARVSSVDVAGEGDRDELLRIAALDVGAAFDQTAVSQAALRIQGHFDRQGYRDAVVVVRSSPAASSPSEHDVDLVFDVAPGPRHVVRAVSIAGDGRTRPGWATKVADIELGRQLDASLLADGRRRLLATGLFDTVYLQTIDEPDGSVRLGVELDERPRWSLGYGIRWESEEGAGAVVDVLDRNLLGRGIQLGARALYTDRRQAFRVYSTLPRIAGSRYSLEAFAEARAVDDDVFQTDTFETSLQLSRPLSRFGTGRVYARYTYDHITDDDPFLPLDDRLRNPFVGLQYIWDNRADILSGSSGLLASLDLSGSGDALGSSFSYARLFGQVQYTRNAFRLGQRRMRWAQSLRIGLAEAGSQPLRSDLRFFAGGEYSVRGYRTESLGPVEGLGSISRQRGGEALLILNQELRFPIVRKVGGVLFWDAGEVWERVSELELRLRQSLGLGLRYRSPVGLLRLDVGFPIDRRPGDPSYRVYAGLGQVF